MRYRELVETIRLNWLREVKMLKTNRILLQSIETKPQPIEDQLGNDNLND